jgi:hypothetical protein
VFWPEVQVVSISSNLLLCTRFRTIVPQTMSPCCQAISVSWSGRRHYRRTLPPARTPSPYSYTTHRYSQVQFKHTFCGPNYSSTECDAEFTKICWMQKLIEINFTRPTEGVATFAVTALNRVSCDTCVSCVVGKIAGD